MTNDPLAAMRDRTYQQEGLLVALVTSGFPQAHYEQTGGGVTTLVVPLPNGASIHWLDDGGWWYDVQDQNGEQITSGARAIWPSRVLGMTRALAKRYS